MKYLKHCVPIKILATLIASLSLLVSLLSIVVIAMNGNWLVEDSGDWYRSEQMGQHNRIMTSLMATDIEHALVLASYVEELPELVDPEALANIDSGYTAEQIEYQAGSNVENQRVWIENLYEANRLHTEVYAKRYAVSNGERILYLDQTTAAEQADEQTDTQSNTQSDKQQKPTALAGDLDALLDLLADSEQTDVIVIDLVNSDFYVHGERYSHNYVYTLSSNNGIRYIAYLPNQSAENIDGFFGYKTAYEQLAPNRMPILFTAIGSAILFIVLFIYLWLCTGYKRREDGSYALKSEISLAWFDRIPFEIMSLLLLAAASILVALGVELSRYDSLSYWWNPYPFFSSQSISLMPNALGWLALFLFYLAIVVAAIFFLSFIRRLKAKSFWRYSAGGYLFGVIKQAWQKLMQRIDGKPAMLLLLIPYFLMVLLFLGLFERGYYDGGALFLAFLIAIGLFLVLPVLVISKQIQLRRSTAKLTELSTALVSGEDINTLTVENLDKHFVPLEQNLRRLDEGLQVAVQKQLQADRLKTDLITNVSHDLKTPLTSIINYIDLLKREDLDREDAPSYLETLDQKADRLKQLTEDLVEASKASSGNLSVTREWMDLIELMRQVGGEFDEKMQERQLTLVMRLPENMPRFMVWSDGSHIWRIIENLMGNAQKYALAGSRVYVSLVIRSDACTLEVKNVSATPIDLSTSDLLERFVRGDAARSSEGSGLGLSITTSLAALLGGRMDLDVRDDVFTAIVTLPYVNAPYPPEGTPETQVIQDI